MPTADPPSSLVLASRPLSIFARQSHGLTRSASLLSSSNSLGGLVSAIASRLGIGELATGGLQLAVLGGVLAGFRYLGGYLWAYMKKRVIVTAEFDSRDESYSWILNWLSEHPYSRRATQFSVSTTIIRANQRLTGEGIDAMLPPIYFLPAPGLHLFLYNRQLLWLTRERSNPSLSSLMPGSKTTTETIRISVFGRSRDLIQNLVYEAQRMFIERDKSRTVVFSADQYGAWRRTRSRPKRPLSSVVIQPSVKSDLVADAQEFITSEQWYSDRGIPYRRGYLLHGTPGSGKTSFVYSLAGELGLNIYVVNLSNKSLTDDTLNELVTETPSRCILLIEDVDAAFVQREKGDTTTSNNLTFSGLLNAIDGVAAQEGRILCMTTNHVDKLDQALIRPGRIDRRVLFGHATQHQAEELFTKFYPHLDLEKSKKLGTDFATQIPEEKFSMAHLQGFLMSHKGSPQGAVSQVSRWVEGQLQHGEKEKDTEPTLEEDMA